MRAEVLPRIGRVAFGLIAGAACAYAVDNIFNASGSKDGSATCLYLMIVGGGLIWGLK